MRLKEWKWMEVSEWWRWKDSLLCCTIDALFRCVAPNSRSSSWLLEDIFYVFPLPLSPSQSFHWVLISDNFLLLFGVADRFTSAMKRTKLRIRLSNKENIILVWHSAPSLSLPLGAQKYIWNQSSGSCRNTSNKAETFFMLLRTITISDTLIRRKIYFVTWTGHGWPFVVTLFGQPRLLDTWLDADIHRQPPPQLKETSHDNLFH